MVVNGVINLYCKVSELFGEVDPPYGVLSAAILSCGLPELR